MPLYLIHDNMIRLEQYRSEVYFIIEALHKTMPKREDINSKVKPRLLCIKDASVYLGRSVWAVRSMLWSGKLPFVKDGKRILLDVKDIEDWIEANKMIMTDAGDIIPYLKNTTRKL